MFKTYLIITLVLFGGYLYSSTKIEGFVLDKSTGDPLPGANIIIVESSIGTAADLRGYYALRSIQDGEYTLKITYIGYHEREIKIKVSGEKSVRQDIKMESGSVIEGEEIIVMAQAKGQMSAINQQLSSRTVSNVVSADRIQEIPDANAAESIGRLPGVSLIRSSGEGDKVVIRGVQPQLNQVTLNGVRMPSTDENNNSVGLAGISQYMLEGINVQKTLTPENDGDVVGGIVDLKLSNAPEGWHGNLILEGTYNGLSQSTNSFKSMGQVSNRFFNNLLGLYGQIHYEQNDRSNELFTAYFSRNDTKDYDVTLGGGSFGYNEILRKRFSVSIIGDYILPNGKIQFNSVYNRLNEDSWMRNMQFQSFDGQGLSKSHNSTTWDNDSYINSLNLETDILGMNFDAGVSMTGGYRNEPHANYMGMRIQGVAIDSKFLENNQDRTGYEVLPYIYDETSQYILTGLRKTMTEFEEKEQTYQANLEIPFVMGNNFSGFVKFGGKYRRKNRMNDVDFDGPINISGNTERINTTIIRENPEFDFGYTVDSRPLGQMVRTRALIDDWTKEVLDNQMDLRNFLPRDIVDQIITRCAAVNWDDITLAKDGAYDVERDYDGSEKLSAGYLMSEVNIGKRITLLGGFRYEHKETDYSGYGGITRVDQVPLIDTLDGAKRTNFHWLPSANCRYQITDWMDIRLAYSKSVARPEYFHFIPHYTADLRRTMGGAGGGAGNIQLRPAVSNNYDAALSLYGNKLGLFTISGFYKEIDDFQYLLSFEVIDAETDNEVHNYNFTVPKSQFISVWFNNPNTSYVGGAEFDLQTNFWYLPKPLNGLVCNINYTYIKSRSYYYQSDILQEQTGPMPWDLTETRVDSFETRRLINQPKNTFNVSIGYDFKGFSTRLAYYFQGNTLRGKGSTRESDQFSRDYRRWDLSVRQKLPWKGTIVFMNLNNITNVPDVNYQFIKRYHTREEYYGRTGSLGIRFTF